ncbi:hypothetical protein PZB21_25845 [Rhizobium sp. CBK13]|uniref:hypothetical protein n=1 Tax=Rhizobium sp. CBK13 TaxID=3031399 RepID=UPI0023AFB409|nr:hypothetical protein [Rhizobium sp. CBK13]MDE8762599.1 hypothetical protein [Rhizobium sp. CBK13]
MSILIGWGASLSFVLGSKPEPAAMVKIDGGSIGVIESLRMPIGARSKADINTFQIENAGGDDYARVFVNNYLVLSDENPNKIFYFPAAGILNEKKRKKFLEMAVDRRENTSGVTDVTAYLKQGYNYIIVENENSTLGACSTGISISVNGQKLEGFPKSIPVRFTTEAAVLNSELVRRYKEVHLPHLSNALCARRIFSVFLQ